MTDASFVASIACMLFYNNSHGLFVLNLNSMHCDRAFGRVMWIDKDECALGTRCKGGVCQNLIAKDVNDKGFQCKCNAGYATIFSDQVCSREPIDGMA